MGKELKITTKYKKDLKAYKHKPDILQELNKVIDILLSGETLPEKYKNHTLGGNLKDINDCHVKPNDVLLYKINETEVTLIRFGPHNKLELTENNKKDGNIMKLYMREINQEDFDVMSLLKDIPEEDIDHWQTDLYLRKTPEVISKVIKKLPPEIKKSVGTFIDDIDRVTWYEIPFVFPRERNRKGVKESLDKTLPILFSGNNIDVTVTDKWPTGKKVWNIGNHNPYIKDGYVIVCNTRNYNVIPETLEFVYVGADNAKALHKEAGRHTVNDKNYKKYLVADTNEFYMKNFTESKERYTVDNLKKLIRDLLDEKGFYTGVVRYNKDKNTLDISLAEVNDDDFQWEVITTPIGKLIDFDDIDSIAKYAEATVDTVIGKYYDLDESVLTEDEIETWDVSFWDAEEMETYDLKTVRMTKDEVKNYVDKLNAKRTERDKENGSFYDYVLA